jgi:hypothetical protein
MPVVVLPSQKSLELGPDMGPGANPYVVQNPCFGEGQCELNEVEFHLAHGQSVVFRLLGKGKLKNNGHTELTVTTPGL